MKKLAITGLICILPILSQAQSTFSTLNIPNIGVSFQMDSPYSYKDTLGVVFYFKETNGIVLEMHHVKMSDWPQSLPTNIPSNVLQKFFDLAIESVSPASYSAPTYVANNGIEFMVSYYNDTNVLITSYHRFHYFDNGKIYAFSVTGNSSNSSLASTKTQYFNSINIYQ